MVRMRLVLGACMLVAGCGSGGEGGNQAAPDPEVAALTGLYEGAGAGPRRARMCVVPGAGAEPRFGLIVWGQGEANCTMTGTARRQGTGLRLTADPECSVEAALDGDTIRLPANLPRGCAYYCGPNASLGGATFARSRGEPRQAVDLAGDPLCG